MLYHHLMLLCFELVLSSVSAWPQSTTSSKYIRRRKEEHGEQDGFTLRYEWKWFSVAREKDNVQEGRSEMTLES